MLKSLVVVVLTGSSLIAATVANAESKSPIFGQAAVQVTTQSENKGVVGKGYLADYYGYYGNYYNNLAGYYGTLGAYYKSYSYYSSASNYAYDAYTYYNYASSYQKTGS